MSHFDPNIETRDSDNNGGIGNGAPFSLVEKAGKLR